MFTRQYRHAFMGYLVFCLCVIPSIAQAEPRFVLGSRNFSKNTKIFLGNCVSDQKCFIHLLPTSHWTSESVFLDLVFSEVPSARWDKVEGYKLFKVNQQKRPTSIFGLATHGVSLSQKGVLYQMDGTSGKELQHYVLPFAIKQGAFAISDAFYANAWRTLLAVSIRHATDTESALLIFDITDPSKPLKPCMTYHGDKLPLKLGKPTFLRFREGDFGIAVGGVHNNNGTLQIFSLNNSFLPIQLKVGEGPLSFLSAIDLNRQAIVDKIYCADPLQWWVINLASTSQVSIKKLTEGVQVFSSPIVVKDPHSMNLRLYFLGKNKIGQGLFVVRHALKEEDKLAATELIAQGDYKSCHIKFGRLILIPRSLKEAPGVINMNDHRRILEPWHEIAKADVEKNVVISELLWDPIHQQEIVFSLNSSCQLSIFAARFNQKKYGRTLLRNINNK
jgi:hypothetical protein